MAVENFCTPIFEAARRHPHRLALRVPRAGNAEYQTDDLTYGELLLAVGHEQAALRSARIEQGDRVLLFARPGIGFYVLVLAMLASGVVPLMVERGMPRDRLRAVLQASGAKAVIGERAVMRLWWLFPALWHISRWALDGAALGVSDWLRLGQAAQAFCVPVSAQSHGIITYTSGSTGVPKGADRTHASLIAQHHAIRSHWPDQEGEVDFPSFPVLVLHNLCCGISTVMPHTDLAFPGEVKAKQVLSQLASEGITRLSGAPAYLHGLTTEAERLGLRYPHVRAIAIGGATLSLPLLHRVKTVFPKAEVMVVYGSTEAEPISEVMLETLVRDWHQHEGHLVGRPADCAEVCVVPPRAHWADAEAVQLARLGVEQEGEILVAGQHVLSAYVDQPEATRLTKIPRSDGLVWHRTGDMGFFDAQGRLWLTGRTSDRIPLADTTMSPFPVEKAVDALSGVVRSALISNRGKTALVVQGEVAEPRALQQILCAAGLAHITIHRVQRMPVDMRHNSKLDRPTLRHMLQKGRLS